MKKKVLSLLILLITGCTFVAAQDTLPKFSVKSVGNNRVIIGWTNTFKVIKQISIQRSYDSIANFKTILTVPDPTAPQNGYLDTKATNDHMFYRLYILLDRGSFLFSEAKRPFHDTTSLKANVDDSIIRSTKNDIGGRFEAIKGADSAGSPDLSLQDKNKPDVFTPSNYVFTYKTGYVRVNLPNDDKKYSIKFFDEDGTLLFELKDLKERQFSIDKADFYHAGWFTYELYADGKLVQKYKFYLEKEF